MTEEDPPRERGQRPNKTALKREIAARAELLERATRLNDQELARLGLDEDAIAEIGKVRAIRPSGARKRQLKYCLKQLADEDFDNLRIYLEDRQSQQVEANRTFHRLERWRDRLIAEGDALIGEAAAEWPGLDRQQLRQLIRDARRERDTGKPAGAARKLFRHLRELSGL
jgi:ribosome-associated protein